MKASLRPSPTGSLFIASLYLCGMGIDMHFLPFLQCVSLPSSFQLNSHSSKVYWPQTPCQTYLGRADLLKAQCTLTTSLNMCNYSSYVYSIRDLSKALMLQNDDQCGHLSYLLCVLTCSPQDGPLLIIGVEGFWEWMGLLQAVQQFEEMLGRHTLIHALILRLYVDICIQRVLLEKGGWENQVKKME